jgi:hypothetical protein
MKVKIGKYRKEGKERKIEIKIDSWDTWNMDHTLALIIVPMLKQLKETKHGAPGDMLGFQQTSTGSAQFTFPFYEQEDMNAWAAGHDQWNEIMDKMIWSFEQLLDDDRDTKFWTAEPIYDKKLKRISGGVYDEKAAQVYYDRVQEGFELFGKYYRSLWD